jgi:hypothetical protein
MSEAVPELIRKHDREVGPQIEHEYRAEHRQCGYPQRGAAPTDASHQATFALRTSVFAMGP